jgi:prephenate dehydrogenase
MSTTSRNTVLVAGATGNTGATLLRLLEHNTKGLPSGGEQMIKRVLGHTDERVTAICNRYGYVKEMRQCSARARAAWR